MRSSTLDDGTSPSRERHRTEGPTTESAPFEVSSEQRDLRDEVRRFLRDKGRPSHVRGPGGPVTGSDPAVWAQMCGQLGLTGVAVPERFGGAGGSWVELGIVLEEMGYALHSSPFFATVVLAATALIESGDEDAQQAILPGIVTGSTRAALAWVEQSGDWSEAGITATARRTGSGHVVEGRKPFTIDGRVADVLIVPARTERGVSLFLVRGDAPRLTREPQATLDQTRNLATITLDATPARLIGTDGEGWSTLARVLDLACAGLAAEQAGGARAALDRAVAYAKERVQFGRPIGSFQALKHMCADMMLEVESATSAARYAAWAASEAREDLPVVASLAKSYCSEAFVHAAHQSIQIHGGLGFTWECDAHLYYKRARSMELYLGTPQLHRERVADLIGMSDPDGSGGAR